MAVYTINITKVGGSTTSVDLNKFLGALEGCDPVNDVVSIDGIQYVLSSAELGGGGSSVWGNITGDLTNQTDLTDALSTKADLVSGVVPSYQLPSYVDDVIVADTASNFPVTGEEGKLYIAKDSNHQYRWSDALPGYVDMTGGDIGNGTIDWIPVVKTVNGIKILTFQNSWRSQDANYSISSKPNKSPRVVAGADLDGNYKLVVDGISLFAGNINLQDLINRKIEWGLGGASIEQIDVGNNRTILFGKSTVHKFTDNNGTDKFETVIGGAYQEGEKLATENWADARFQTKPISLTYTDAEALASIGGIVNGQAYLITDVADLGILLIGSPNPKKFQTQALGGFLNADFQDVGDYDLVESITGFTKNNFYGIWTPALMASLANGDFFIYNNDLWQVVIEGDIDISGTITPVMDAGPFYRFLRSNFNSERVGYIQEWDAIEYDFENNLINWRLDKRNNQINSVSRQYFHFGDDSKTGVLIFDSQSYINTLNNTSNLINVTLSNNCSVDVSNSQGEINNCSYSDGDYTIILDNSNAHFNCKCSNNQAFVFPSNKSFTGKVLDNETSTFNADFVITGITDINLASINYAGVITLLSENDNEIINNIANPKIKRIEFVMVSEEATYRKCDISFRDMSLSSGNILIPTQALHTTPVDLGTGSFFLRLTQSDNYISIMKGKSFSIHDVAEFQMDITNELAKLIRISNYIIGS